MKSNLLVAVLVLVISGVSVASSGGSVELIDGRLKVQFGLDRKQSRGSYQLRSILEKHGFKNDGGFVRTRDALAPLEIYNYLYDNGSYVFTIFLPIEDEKLFVSFNEKGFVSLIGVAAQRLFEIVKLYVHRSDINNLEQYNWTNHAYCDRTKSGEIKYRCFFDK